MLPAEMYVIRPATPDDDEGLRWLAEIDSSTPVREPVLIAEVDGRITAALSLADDRAIANPFKPTAQLVAFLRMRAGALRTVEAAPSLRDRLQAAVRPRSKASRAGASLAA
jgi:hypothetical protein